MRPNALPINVPLICLLCLSGAALIACGGADEPGRTDGIGIEANPGFSSAQTPMPYVQAELAEAAVFRAMAKALGISEADLRLELLTGETPASLGSQRGQTTESLRKAVMELLRSDPVTGRLPSVDLSSLVDALVNMAPRVEATSVPATPVATAVRPQTNVLQPATSTPTPALPATAAEPTRTPAVSVPTPMGSPTRLPPMSGTRPAGLPPFGGTPSAGFPPLSGTPPFGAPPGGLPRR
jgi:hypothetical protein